MWTSSTCFQTYSVLITSVSEHGWGICAAQAPSLNTNVGYFSNVTQESLCPRHHRIPWTGRLNFSYAHTDGSPSRNLNSRQEVSYRTRLHLQFSVTYISFKCLISWTVWKASSCSFSGAKLSLMAFWKTSWRIVPISIWRVAGSETYKTGDIHIPYHNTVTRWLYTIKPAWTKSDKCQCISKGFCCFN